MFQRGSLLAFTSDCQPHSSAFQFPIGQRFNAFSDAMDSKVYALAPYTNSRSPHGADFSEHPVTNVWSI